MTESSRQPPWRGEAAAMIRVSERLPPIQHRVIVICETFRCLGYIDAKAIWRDDFKNREITGVVGWIELS